MKYILELEDEPNKEYFGEGNYYRCKQIPYWSISESMRNRLEPYDEADRKTENNSEKPNNCDYAENPSGDVWECGCFLDTYCEHQIYDRNPDGTINIVECGYEPKDEPQTCSVNGRPYSECGSCEHFKCTADEPQTNKEIVLDPSFAELSDEQFVEAMKLIEPQTDCPWK